LSIPDDVYAPAEDSFMLADAASSLRGSVLEMGCGSGIASLSCARADARNSVLGIDINPWAVRCATGNAAANGITNASFMEGDLFSSVGARSFDAIMFNPPYLPTDEGSERVAGPLNHAFDGGPGGRDVIERFLSSFCDHLSPGGRLLLLQSSLNGPDETRHALEEKGFEVRLSRSEAFFFEKLLLFEASRI